MRAAVINQEAADLYFNGKPLGAAVIDEGGVRTQIIGLVRSQVFGTFEQHAEPTIYFPMRQDPVPRMTLMLKDSQWNNALAADLRHKIGSVPGQGSTSIGITTLDSQLAHSGLAPLRIATLIGGVSAAIAIMLSMVGLISTQSDAERQLQPERALRIALGAQRWCRGSRLLFAAVHRIGNLHASEGAHEVFSKIRVPSTRLQASTRRRSLAAPSSRRGRRIGYGNQFWGRRETRQAEGQSRPNQFNPPGTRVSAGLHAIRARDLYAKFPGSRQQLTVC